MSKRGKATLRVVGALAALLPAILIALAISLYLWATPDPEEYPEEP